MFRRYAFCLGPALAAYLIILLLSANSGLSVVSQDVLVWMVFILLGFGMLYCATVVARKVLKSKEAPDALTWILTVLTFIGVAIGYIAIAFAGCCGVALVGDGLR